LLRTSCTLAYKLRWTIKWQPVAPTQKPTILENSIRKCSDFKHSAD